MNPDVVKSLPKVDIHCHLDGSISPDALKHIVDVQGGKHSDFLRYISAPANCSNLTEYLKPFAYVLKWLQEKDALKMAAYDVIKQASKENVVYMEIRFAPNLHCEKDLSCETSVAAVLEGVKRAGNEFGIKCGVILCLMRGHSFSDNMHVIDTANNFIGQGVVGVDLAGDESQFPPEQYIQLFKSVSDRSIPITIHAGENGPAKYVETAIQMGASRIGHGIAIMNCEETRKLCVERDILLELCPVSNLQTKAANCLDEYPLLTFWEQGIPISINTDNRTVSNTNLTKEFLLLSSIGMDYDKMEQITLCALKHSFLSSDEKYALESNIKNRYREILHK